MIRGYLVGLSGKGNTSPGQSANPCFTRTPIIEPVQEYSPEAKGFLFSIFAKKQGGMHTVT